MNYCSVNKDPDSFLVIRRNPGDRETSIDVENFVNEVGFENVLLSLPRRRDKSESYRIPQPQSGKSAVIKTNISLLLVIVIMATVI